MSGMSQELFSHGSTWVRDDFHLHTRADGEFVYEDDLFNPFLSTN